MRSLQESMNLLFLMRNDEIGVLTYLGPFSPKGGIPLSAYAST